ncbi:hypothetical protein [Halomarina oriensis]|uniref:Uncharacterized protein n=1 Tax=Halomarina oriensis TaxID=671145 RepID=A0A6B0GDU0_9EURY|nr:hypothetical protein [Halomarina oriensis]MWG32972.1 hypothetical protein [Halomarina oriensis]
MTDLFIINGESAEGVEALQNVPTSPDATAIAEFSPERGMAFFFRNRVERGEQTLGLPIFGSFVDANGDPLPVNTSLYLALKLKGRAQAVKVSDRKGNISFYQNSVDTQQDVDNIDGAKFVLRQTEEQGGAPVEHIRVRDIDSFRLMCDSSAQIDWSQSEMYVDAQAVTERELGN